MIVIVVDSDGAADMVVVLITVTVTIATVARELAHVDSAGVVVFKIDEEVTLVETVGLAVVVLDNTVEEPIASIEVVGLTFMVVVDNNGME